MQTLTFYSRRSTTPNLEPPDYDDDHHTTTAADERNQRKMSHLHRILRERREASLALDNLLRVPPPSAEGMCVFVRVRGFVWRDRTSFRLTGLR